MLYFTSFSKLLNIKGRTDYSFINLSRCVGQSEEVRRWSNLHCSIVHCVILKQLIISERTNHLRMDLLCRYVHKTINMPLCVDVHYKCL